MKTATVLRAFIVSVILALLTTLVTSVLSATYLAQPMGAQPMGTQSTVITGIEAIRLWIDVVGFWGVAKGHVGWFLSVTISSFIACLVFLRWETRTAND
jgi:hypothetical protein